MKVWIRPTNIRIGCMAGCSNYVLVAKRVSCLLWLNALCLLNVALIVTSGTVFSADRPGVQSPTGAVQNSDTHRDQGAAADESKNNPPAQERRDVAEWFRKLDANQDGLLTEGEVPAEVWTRLKRVDLDNDGKVALADVQDARQGDSRPGGAGGSFEVATFTGSGGSTLRYSWLGPAKLESGKSYPLVLCLHGRGGSTRAAGVLATDALREKYPCFLVAPECNKPDWWASNPALGRGTQGEKLPLAIELVRSLLKEKPIDAARVYVTGQSMGGVGSWACAARHADLFAAAVPVCGAWSVDDVPKMKTVPIWAFHGERDTTVPTRFSRELTIALKELGSAVKYTEYPGVGHGSWEAAYADQAMWKWLFDQKKAAVKE